MLVTSNYDEVVRLRVAFPDNPGFRKRYPHGPDRFEETTWANWESYVAIIIFCQA